MTLQGIQIRTIQPADNISLAALIRAAMTELGVDRPGTVFDDPTTDALYELFRAEGSAYYVAEENGVLLGGAGIFPTQGLPAGVCELVKMYLHKDARNKGLGRLLIDNAIAAALRLGYTKMYLETMPELAKAVRVYETFGFRRLDGPMGSSGHFSCDIWMIKEL